MDIISTWERYVHQTVWVVLPRHGLMVARGVAPAMGKRVKTSVPPPRASRKNPMGSLKLLPTGSPNLSDLKCRKLQEGRNMTLFGAEQARGILTDPLWVLRFMGAPKLGA